MWGGLLLYLIYTFLIFCFSVHFNQLFIFYCFILGLSFYAFLYFVHQVSVVLNPFHIKSKNLIRITGIYFITISLFFYLLWLWELVPAILNQEAPGSLQESGLVTNPVHVIDLALFLPALFIAGTLLLKRKRWGLVLTPVLLTFLIVMNITIASLVVVMNSRGLGSDYTVAIVMSALALFSFGLLIWIRQESSFEKESLVL